ncbi:MAG TPA: LysR family transcriptional regulator [Clostridiales bacterium]|nr:LysR family transcriptional regulator [Clostridiales bacterium]
MDLHYLKLFHAIARYGSFKKASEILHITQPALSIQIKKLEEQTGLKLFYRSGNRTYLSEDGLVLYGYTEKIFELVEEMEKNISGRIEYIGGTINLGGSNTPGTYILPKVIGEMKRRYPNVTFNLHIANTSEIATLVENGSLDVAVSGGKCSYHSSVYVEKILNDRLAIVASVENPLVKQGLLSPGDLRQESFIVHEKTSQLYTDYKLFTEQAKLRENIGMHLGSIDAIKQAVAANLGISIMPCYAVKAELELGLLKELTVRNFRYDYPYNLIYNKKRTKTLTAQKFIEVLHEVCKGLGQGEPHGSCESGYCNSSPIEKTCQ